MSVCIKDRHQGMPSPPCLQAHASRVHTILLDYQKKLQERTEHHMG